MGRGHSQIHPTFSGSHRHYYNLRAAVATDIYLIGPIHMEVE